MRLQQMIIGMVLLLSFGVSQAGETRHFFGIYSDDYSDSDLSGESFQYGYDFSNLLSLEVNYSTPDSLDADVKVDSVSSLMVRFNQRYESINTYFMVGVSQFVTTDLIAPVEKESLEGVSYGFGLELYGSKNTAISFTWSKNEYDTDAGGKVDVDITRIGLIHHFDFGKSHGRY